MIRKYPLLSFILLVVGTPYLITLPLLWAGIEQHSLAGLKLLFALTPLIYVSLVVFVSEGEEGIQRLFGNFWRRVPTFWYLFSLLIFLMIALLALGIRWLDDGFFPPVSEFGSWIEILGLSIPLLIFPGVTEEFAWRGFLQAKLQLSGRHWWTSSVIVGLVWGSWHGFDFLLGNWTFSFPEIFGYPLYIISTSIIVGFAFDRSGKSVLMAMIAHFGANIVNFFTPVFQEYGGSVMPAVYYLAGLLLTAFILRLFGGTQNSADDPLASV